jgi:Rod binding domain-containing protein
MGIGNIVDPGTIYNNHNYDKDIFALKRASENKSANGIPGKKRDEKLYGTCQEFESIIIKQMLNVMRKTVEKNGLINGGAAEEIFEDMLYDNYSLMMAKNSGFGLADLIYRQLTPQEFGIISPASQNPTNK